MPAENGSVSPSAAAVATAASTALPPCLRTLSPILVAYGSTVETAPPYPLLVGFFAGAAAAAASGWSPVRGSRDGSRRAETGGGEPGRDDGGERGGDSASTAHGSSRVGGLHLHPCCSRPPLSTPARRPRLSRSPLVPAQEAFHVRRSSYRPEDQRRDSRGRPVRGAAGRAGRGAHATEDRRAGARAGRARREGPPVAARGLRVPVLPRHGAAGDPDRRHRAAGAARRDGCLQGTRRHRAARPQPRGQRRPARLRPGRAVRRDGRRRHHHHPGDPLRRGDPLLHQPQRHDDELLGRSDALGCLGDLRGDHQRSRRRPGLHRGLQRPAHPAARVRLRGAGERVPRRGPVEPAAARGAPDGSPTRPCRSTPGRASCTSPRTTSASPPASTATRRPRTRWRSASSGTAAPCTCSR